MQPPKTFTNVDNVIGADSIPALSVIDALRERGPNLSLFTPALLFTHAGFDRDPVVEFDARFPAPSPELRPFCIDLKKENERFFSGMGIMPAPGGAKPIAWDKRIYGIDDSRVEDCFAFLGGIAYSSPRLGIFAQSFEQRMAIKDPTAINTEFLIVSVFGAMSNKFAVFMAASFFDDTPCVRLVPTKDSHLIPAEIQAAAVTSGFTGLDPLDMRD